jgi:stage III sporulation protein AA
MSYTFFAEEADMRSLKANLPDKFSKLIEDARPEEVRFRVGQRMEIMAAGRRAFLGEALTGEDFLEVFEALSGHSRYAFEAEIRRGFFTLEDGSRVGVTGRFALEGERVLTLAGAQALCVRVAREVRGCADGLMPALLGGGAPSSVLIVSPPGMGKTTMLRDAARQLSLRGFHVAIADERGEIAGARLGRPTSDIGPTSDVADGLPKSIAIPQLLHTMAPDVIVTDELGAPGDAQAVLDALRCGVAVVASAHGQSLRQISARPALGALVEGHAFSAVAVLGGRPGNILSIHALGEEKHERAEY